MNRSTTKSELSKENNDELTTPLDAVEKNSPAF
jgi:hypothetical protein